MNKALLVLAITLLAFLVGCGSGNDREWYKTKEKAIEEGINKEDASKLGFEVFNGKTVVLFKKSESLGVATITEGEDGYSWTRNEPLVDFQSEPPYSLAKVEIKTDSETNIPVAVGKTSDKSITKMLVTGEGINRELHVDDESGLFYLIHEVPFESLEFSPIKKGE